MLIQETQGDFKFITLSCKEVGMYSDHVLRPLDIVPGYQVGLNVIMGRYK